MNSILVICVGNICRSPMAAGLLAQRFPLFNIKSAGIAALQGRPADAIAQIIMKEHSIDITEHIAMQVNARACRKADIIFVMDHDQRKFLEHEFPFVRGKVFRIAENLNRDVPDPFGRGRYDFESAFELISSGVDSWEKRIRKTENI